MTPLAEAADLLRALVQADDLLVLPNAWDAASARLFEGMGYPALATTSAGVANAIGYADHEETPPDEMFAAVGRIAASVDVPVTADLETGYGLPAESIVQRLLEVGGVGLNIEDSVHRLDGSSELVDPGHHAERLAAIKVAGRAAGVDVVLNARVDSFLRGLDVDDALARSRTYVEAGVDSVYPIGVSTEEDIAALVEGAGVPVNVLAHPRAPGRERLEALGVKRVTFGGLLATEALGAAERMLSEF